MKHFFYQGSSNLLDRNKEETDFERILQIIKPEIAKVLETRNLSFLIGSGCSSGEGGIPTMSSLADMFYYPNEDVLKKMTPLAQKLILDDDCKKILKELEIDCTKNPFNTNIEIFLGTLFSLRFYYEQICNDEKKLLVEKIISKTKTFILYQSLNVDNEKNDAEIEENYKNFYRKLSLRDNNLPKPNVFTTNYDLYSEKAMDELGITYTNGFSGFIERYFNPSIFNYALAEQMDISSFKWNVIDSYIYLFKIHGSVNWIEVQDSNKLFKIKELQDSNFDRLRKELNLMIYPSPIKQNASLGTPYSDLFREFQRRITQKQSVLVTMGYSFNDEHINNIIYQALTIPTFRLLIFSNIGMHVDGSHITVKENIHRLKKLNDPRVWIIGSDEEYEKNNKIKGDDEEKKLYLFSTITKDILPDWSTNQIEEKNRGIIELMKNVIKTNDKININD